MDFLHLIINSRKSNICSLCFRKSSHLAGIYDELEIHDEYFAYKTNINNIMRSLFPSHDLFLAQVCEDCSTLVLKIFNLIHKSCRRNEMLHYLLDNLNDELDLKYFDEIKTTKCRLKINLPQKVLSCYKNTEVTCEKYLMKFSSEYFLKKHDKISHENANNAVICDTCGKTFDNNTKLKAHLNCHKEKECPYCFKILKSHSYFKLHLRRHKSNNIAKRRVKYLKCNDCDYQSINKCTLQAHISKIHLNFRPFKCQICETGFYKKDNLMQHLLTHEKNKPNLCFICGDRFVLERTLNEHLKLHMGQKPYSCDICKIGFVTSGRRFEHMKRKHAEKNECCIICGKKFSLKKDLNIHIKKVHADAKKD